MSAQDRSQISIGYRPEIDGLRAIAVLSVVLFHAGMPWFQGGYAGVDCFFVISGFLITSIALKERQSGTSSVTRFYERRARRILPALLVVLLASTLTAYVIMLPSDLHVFARSVVSVVLFSANILFWTGRDFQRADNYFARLLDREPLIHTWSLGVEEQFYLIFPLIMVAGWSLGRRRLSQLLTLLTLLSFAIAEIGSRRHPKGAFYLLPSRSWELTLGALVACYFTRLSQLSWWARQALAWSGLMLILASVCLYDATARFPGFAALAPTVGCALILACATETGAGRVLAWRPLVVIGLMSYSLYLWHQPVLAFARYVSLTDPPAQVPTPLAIGLAALITLLVVRDLAIRGNAMSRSAAHLQSVASSRFRRRGCRFDGVRLVARVWGGGESPDRRHAQHCRSQRSAVHDLPVRRGFCRYARVRMQTRRRR